MYAKWLVAYHSWCKRREETEQKERIAQRNIPSSRFNSEYIAWNFADGDSRILQWNDIAMIGYVTFDIGPWLNDWFLVFIDKSSKSYWISLCSLWPGAEKIANYVNQMNGVVLGEKGALVNSTNNDSVVVWPAERAGEPLPEKEK